MWVCLCGGWREKAWKPEGVNPVSETDYFRQTRELLRTLGDKEGKKKNKFREHIKGERGEGGNGVQALGMEGGRSHMSSLWSFNETHMLCVFTQFVWSSQKHTSDSSIPNLNTSNTTVSNRRFPKHFIYFKALTTLQKRHSDYVTLSWLKTNHHDHSCNITEQHEINQYPDKYPNMSKYTKILMTTGHTVVVVVVVVAAGADTLHPVYSVKNSWYFNSKAEKVSLEKLKAVRFQT